MDKGLDIFIYTILITIMAAGLFVRCREGNHEDCTIFYDDHSDTYTRECGR